jgi:hypothetical protein
MKYYPYLYLVFRIYNIIEYLSFTKNILYFIINFFKKKEINKDIDEIYDIVLKCEDSDGEEGYQIGIIDDTNYKKYNETEKKLSYDYFL